MAFTTISLKEKEAPRSWRDCCWTPGFRKGKTKGEEKEESGGNKEGMDPRTKKFMSSF
jgi:hypothetical protein